ncbi:MAG: hypothetical protein WAM07_08515 [Halobacillus sp.]|uniref:hypothetical protein n=1 Tax=Halobacillus sp. TaxID=56800 RepID=UPI003BB0A82B
MNKRQAPSFLLGIITILITSYLLITHRADTLLLPFIQGVLGFIIASMIVSVVYSFRNQQKWSGLFFTFAALFIAAVILTNNTMTIEGVLPVLIMYIIISVPIGIIAGLSQVIKTY